MRINKLIGGVVKMGREKKLARYLEVRDQIKTSDGMLWAGESILGKAIKFITKSDVNHFSVVFDEFSYEVSERKYQLEALKYGIDLTILSDSILGYNGKVYWLPIKEEYEDWRVDLARWFLQQEGRGVKYDYKSLVMNLFGRTLYGTKSMFCSEFGYLGWRYVYIKKVLGVENEEEIDMLLCDKETHIFNFNKAPRPNDMEDMNVWKDRVLIYDSKETGV